MRRDIKNKQFWYAKSRTYPFHAKSGQRKPTVLQVEKLGGAGFIRVPFRGYVLWGFRHLQDRDTFLQRFEGTGLYDSQLS